jgi:hypothetical protein
MPRRHSFPPRRRDSGVLGLELGRAAPAWGISAGVDGRVPLPGVGSRGRSCTAPGVESDSLVAACMRVGLETAKSRWICAGS